MTTAEKIVEFASLPIGWNYGSGKPPSGRVVRLALQIEAILRSHGVPTDAFPGADGEIAVTGYPRDKVLNIMIEEEPWREGAPDLDGAPEWNDVATPVSLNAAAAGLKAL